MEISVDFKIGDRVYYKYNNKNRYGTQTWVGVGTVIDILQKEVAVPENKVLKYFNIDKQDRQFKYFLKSIKCDRLVIREDNKKNKYTIIPISSQGGSFNIHLEKISINHLILINIFSDDKFKFYDFKLPFQYDFYVNYDSAFILNNIETIIFKDGVNKFHSFYVFHKDNNLKLAYCLDNMGNSVTVCILNDNEVLEYSFRAGTCAYADERSFSIDINNYQVIEFLDKYFLIQSLRK